MEIPRVTKYLIQVSPSRSLRDLSSLSLSLFPPRLEFVKSHAVARGSQPAYNDSRCEREKEGEREEPLVFL